MKYFVLLAGPGQVPDWSTLDEEAQGELMGRHDAFGTACEERGVAIASGEALDEGAPTTLRTTEAGELLITDGPFAEAAEGIGGFYVLDAPDLDVVIDLCRVLPPYDIEIRPVAEL